MSMRLNLSGFKLAKLHKLLSDRDPAAVEAVEAKAARELKRRMDPDFAQAFQETLRLVIENGAPVDGLDREGPVHAFLADRLVDLAGRRACPDCDFKYVPLLELLEAVESTPDPVARQALGHLLEGRPLFGRGVPESPIYGFLSRQEATELQSRLEALAEGDDEDVGEIAGELAELLGEITSKSLDVWAFVA